MEVRHRFLICGLLACAVVSGGECKSDVAGRDAKQPTAGAYPAANVIPIPREVTRAPGAFAIRSGTRILVPWDPDAARTGRYLADLLRQTRGSRLTVVQSEDAAAGDRAIVLRLEPKASDSDPESYNIDISPRQVILTARDDRGLFYAAVTLWELCTADPDGSGSTRSANAGSELTLPAMRITDGPRFAWRGLLLDSARHYQSPEFILRLIDWMALHKLNVLHWHLSDDQAWRLQIKKYPRLTEVGAWRVPAGPAAAADIDPTTGHSRLYGGFYSQDTVRRIVAHAAERYITIVPELDMPGHATAAIVAYPWVGVTEHPPASVPADWGIYPNLYNVDEKTFAFIQDVLDEVIGLFPGEYIHVGGDEPVKDQWKASPQVQARMRELGVPNEEALQSYFVQRLEKYLNGRGRRLVGWDEILEGGIAPKATVMSWRGIDGGIAAATGGHDAVLAPWPTLYFDNRQGSGPAEPPGRGRVISLEDVYRFDPMPQGLAGDQRQHILGVQGNLWTEHIRTEDRLSYMAFPRAAAVAENGWSAPERKEWNDFLRRLPAQFARYRALGIRYSDDAFRSASLPQPGLLEKHKSQDLKTCTDKLVLSLEDDAPIRGERAVFLIDIMNPCWIFPSVDLTRISAVQAAVGQVPFNFQLGKDIANIQLNTPHTRDGELEIRMDGCDGEPIAVVPLTGAVGNNAVTSLPPARLRAQGQHDLCFKFTQRTLDPMWAIDWVQLLE